MSSALQRRYGHATLGSAAAGATYLNTAYTLLAAGPHAWANRPAIRAQWLIFAISHVRGAAPLGIVLSLAQNLAHLIELAWHQNGKP